MSPTSSRYGSTIKWHRSHKSLHGDTPMEWVSQRADKTPLRATVSEAYDPAKEHVQVRHHVVDIALRALKGCLCTPQYIRRIAGCPGSHPAVLGRVGVPDRVRSYRSRLADLCRPKVDHRARLPRSSLA